jgi:hypothetical protein
VNLSEFLTINSATAHTHWDKDGSVHCFGFWYKGKDPKYTLFKIPPKTGKDFAGPKLYVPLYLYILYSNITILPAYGVSISQLI